MASGCGSDTLPGMIFSALRHRYRQAVARRREAKKLTTRSPKWHGVAQAHLKAHPNCYGCGSTQHLQVHHKKPYHLHPELELDHTNLVTLCMDGSECHLRIGHGDNFRAWNPNVVPDAAQSLKDPAARPNVWARAKSGRQMGG